MKKIITIGRQFASGGSTVARKLSEITGIPFYDKESLVKISESHGIARETFEKADEQATSSFLYSLAMSGYSGTSAHFGANVNIITDQVFNIQSTEMKKIAEAGDCIFIGRCADDILSEDYKVLKIFIYATMDYRAGVYTNHHPEVEDSAARKFIAKMDKKRASYYSFYTGRSWGDPNNYHLNIDSSALGTDETASIIAAFADKFFKD